MVFVEQDADHTLGNRAWRWSAAFDGGGMILLPMAMVNSGHQVADGYLIQAPGGLYSGYKAMVDAELLRPPQAGIEAYHHRIGDKFRFTIWISNWSDITLSSLSDATVNAIVYEDAHVILTDRITRAVVSTPILNELEPWSTAAFTFETSDLVGVDWNKMHSFVFVDYRPDVMDEPFDILQAAFTLPENFNVLQNDIIFWIEPGSSQEQSKQVQFRGPDCFQWSVSTASPWISLTPLTGTTTDFLDVAINSDLLSPGMQMGEITITADCDGMSQYSEQIPVRAYYGEVTKVYLPKMSR